MVTNMTRRVIQSSLALIIKVAKNERTRLMEALHLNQSLAIAYYQKEDFGQIWQQSKKNWPRVGS